MLAVGCCLEFLQTDEVLQGFYPCAVSGEVWARVLFIIRRCIRMVYAQ